ncbi:MAG: MFS transporter [Bacteroidales bacterium]
MTEQRPAGKLWRHPDLVIIYSITLIAVMGVASITPAFPAVIGYFGIDPSEIAWLITVFTLPGIFLTPFLGLLADRIGRKKVLIPSLILFAIAGSACAFTTSYRTLLILRFFQGVGAASVGSLNLTLIGDLFSKPDRAAAMGYNASVLSLGTALYPALGGLLTLLGWNFPFLFPLLAIPVAFGVWYNLTEPDLEEAGSMTEQFKLVRKALLLPNVIWLFFLSLATFIILYGAVLTVFPVYLSERFQTSGVQIGIIMSVMSVGTALASTRLGLLTRKFSSRLMILAGFAIYFLSILSFPLFRQYYFLFIPALFYGLAQGINIPSIQTLLAGYSGTNTRATVMSVNGMVLRVGQTLGPLIAGWGMKLFSYPSLFTAFAIFSVAVWAGTILFFARIKPA